jgi:CHASE2 domain-containing sensor protein
MNPIIWTIILIPALAVSGIFVYRKRKAAGITGIKTALTSICFYLIGVVNLLSVWFDFIGIISWVSTFILLLAGAYFTKYLPPHNVEAE